MSRQYKHVSLSERIEIEKSLDLGRSQAEIARRLGRSRSTISREIARRSWRASNTSAAYTPYRPAALRTGEWTQRHYRATSAQAHAGRAAQRCHQPRRMRHDRLVAYVRDHLRRGWTPEEIAGRLPLEFADDPAMRVSHETVYAWIYAPTQKGLQLWQYLPRGQRKRRQRGPARKVRRAPQIRYRVPIHHRPIEVEDRTEFGHWEADSVLGARGSGALHTEVERTSRFVIAAKIDAPAAAPTMAAQQAMIDALPAHAVKSITADWGYRPPGEAGQGEGRSSRGITSSPTPPESRPTSRCRTRRGSAAPTSTSTGGSASTCPNAPGSTPSPTLNWPTSSPRSTTAPARSSAGTPQPKSSTAYARPSHTPLRFRFELGNPGGRVHLICCLRVQI